MNRDPNHVDFKKITSQEVEYTDVLGQCIVCKTPFVITSGEQKLGRRLHGDKYKFPRRCPMHRPNGKVIRPESNKAPLGYSDPDDTPIM